MSLDTNDTDYQPPTYQRSVPTNDLDMQMQITDPAWQNLPPALRAKLIEKLGTQLNKDGKYQNVYEELGGILGVYTRDVRLGNLSGWNGEYDYVCYYLELSVDLLESRMNNSAVISINKALSKLEPSSSKSGFLRKLLQTFKTETTTTAYNERKKPSSIDRKERF